MPLTYLNAGESRLIQRIAGKDDVQKHLASLGFVPGEKVTVVSTRGNDLIVQIRESRVAISESLAERIMV